MTKLALGNSQVDISTLLYLVANTITSPVGDPPPTSSQDASSVLHGSGLSFSLAGGLNPRTIFKNPLGGA